MAIANLPQPRGQSQQDLYAWGRDLVDQLRRTTNEALATETSNASELARLQAAIDEINARLQEVIDLLDSLDGETLTTQVAFIRSLQTDLQALFDTMQESLDDAIAASSRTAKTIIRDGLLGLGNTASIRVEQQTRLDEGYAFATQLELMLARIGDAEAAVAEERTVRADGDEAFAQQLISILARVGQTESAIDEERTTRSTLTEALATQLLTVRTAIGGQEYTVNQLVESVDGLSGRFTVSLNRNNHVTGLIDLSGNNEGTQFTVVADRFLVAHPTNTVNPVSVFGIGTVNGVSTVGINGNVIVDGTIRAVAISAASLSAITANLGTVTAGLLRSADSKFIIDLDNKSFQIDF